MPNSAETLRALMVEYDAREKRLYDARNVENQAYEALNANENEETAAAWNAAVDETEAAEAFLNELGDGIERAEWGAATSYYITEGGLTEEDIAYFVMKHDRPGASI